MKRNLFVGLAFLLVSFLPTAEVAAQGKGLVFDGKTQFVQCPATDFPTGTSARTLEFWVRVANNTDGNPHDIISWGKDDEPGSAFGVYTRYVNGQNSFCFWGHYRDIQPIAPVPDDQWHFVALSYGGNSLRFYLDGALRAKHDNVKLNTASGGGVFFANRKGGAYYFEGAIRDVAVWSHVRNQGQIQKDMVPWPALKGDESGLVAYFQLNEGSDNTFSDKKGALKGTIDGKATWSKPISANPDPIDEGIWFVIQNKADLDNDTEKKPRRMALTVSGNSVAWAPIPLEGNKDKEYDAFLWRTVPSNNRYHLVNKKLGPTKALDCGLQNPSIGNFGNYQGQHWAIQPADVDKWGTNVYSLSNDYIGVGTKAIALEGTQVKVIAKNAEQTNQAWVMQPMELAIGYHIPVSDSRNSPMTQELAMAYGFKVYATNTVRDWSVLNAHLIWKNMLNALSTSASANLNGSGVTRKELQIISRFDQSEIVASYPLDTASSQVIFDKDWFTKYRGGSGNDPNRRISSTTVTEEMMCRVGVFSRGYKDRESRVFDQVIHEFGHALDHVCKMDHDHLPDPNPLGSKTETIAAAIQAWFDNNAYGGMARTRALQKTQQPGHYDHLKKFFREENTWMPPRQLCNQPSGRVELKDGESLSKGEGIFSTPPYSPNGTYAYLATDGNFVVYDNDQEDRLFKWGSYNNLKVPLDKVTTLKMENGILRMKDADGKDVYSSTNAASPGARLVLAQPLDGKPDSWLRIVDAGGKVIWTP